MDEYDDTTSIINNKVKDRNDKIINFNVQSEKIIPPLKKGLRVNRSLDVPTLKRDSS